jgi:hypothetical protein
VAGSLAEMLGASEDGGWQPPPLGEKSTSGFSTDQWQRIARSGLRGGADDALETAGSIAGSALGPLGSLGGGLLARELGSLLGLHAHRQPRGESPAQPVYVVMPGVSELLSELVNITRAAQLRSAGGGLDDLTGQLAVANRRAGLIPEVM